jgi:hypothetical protein
LDKFKKFKITIQEFLTRLYCRLSPQQKRLWRRWYKAYTQMRFIIIYSTCRNRKIKNINLFEQCIYSQHGEDGILKMIFYKVGKTNKFCVEVGVGDGSECNTRYLIEKEKWDYLHLDSRDSTASSIKKEFITTENIEKVCQKYRVPKEFDLLSIDIDYNTYWAWRAIRNYHPRVVVVEYNASIPFTESKAVIYDPDAEWDHTNYFGASLLAFVTLAKSKGYTLIGCDKKGVDAFFLRDGLIDNHFFLRDIKELYRPPQYGEHINGKYIGYPISTKKFMCV